MTARRTPVIAVVALLAACSGGSSGGKGLSVTGTVTATGAPGAQVATVDMNDRLQFVPNVVRAASGRLALTARDIGRVPHNLVFDDHALGGTSTVRGGGTATLTLALTRPGTYRFTCTFHPGMDGEVVVTR